MIQLTELTCLDQLMSQCHGGAPPVVEPDERLDLGRLGCLDHGSGVGQRAGDRFFTGTRLAGGDGRPGHRRVHIVGRDHVDQADFRRADELLPIGGGVFPAPIIGKGPGILLRLSKNRVHDGHERRLEEFGHLAPSVRMCSPHEALPDQGHIDRCHDVLLLLIPRLIVERFRLMLPGNRARFTSPCSIIHARLGRRVTRDEGWL